MSSGDYYGRVDYTNTSIRPDEKNMFESIIELLSAILNDIRELVK